MKQHNLLWHKINAKIISDIRIYFTDSLGYPIYLNGQHIDMVIVLKHK